MKSFVLKSLLVCIFFTALGLRLIGLNTQQPFWVDEFSSGTQARLIQDYGYRLITNPQLRKQVGFEHHNIPAHALIAGSFSIFGESEWSARLPFAIIGAAIPLLIFALLSGYGYPIAGIVAALLTTHSHFQILWSVQARGYMLLQASLIAAAYIYWKFKTVTNHKTRNFLLLTCVSAIGMLSHVTFIFMILALIIHYMWTSSRSSSHLIRIVGLLITICLILLMTGTGHVIYSFFSSTFTPVNNVWYYHSFLWRHYTLITFLGVLGIIRMFQKSPHAMIPSILFMTIYMAFISFIFGHYMTKYLLPIFPFLLAGMGYMIVEIADAFTTKRLQKIFIAIAITGIIILNGNVFISKPKSYISLNTHFREISNIDYDAVYKIIASKSSPETAIIETWPGRGLWYLGNDFKNLYMYRWENESGYANGHEKKTAFYIEDGMKKISPTIGFISTAQDVQKVEQLHPTGFLFIDDTSLPESVRLYAEKNFKKELFIDHYPLDENPYSIWPATLYSWGFETDNKLDPLPNP